ncbi:MAG: hypothetical protein R3195_15890 [Gemmatimonadota bacterium]|nr:hypothetical protein [Gemmatimonadota bacterium]
MDHAVALVQAYLELNGYFTVAEFPVLTVLPAGGYASATDIDLLALRLCDAGGLAAVGSGPDGPFEPDPELGVPGRGVDLLLVEVKEGRAELNRGAKDPRVLEAVLARFGLGPHERQERSLRDLDRKGETVWPGGVHVRMLAFGSVVDPQVVDGFRAISLTHVMRFLTEYIEKNWGQIRHAQIRHEAFGFLALIEQVRRSGEPRRDEGDGESPAQ